MDNLSLRQLKEKLIEKGYTVEPKHSQLQDLKELVNDMINYRNNSRIQCNGHINQDFNNSLSIGDINKFSDNIKPQTCLSHAERVCTCRSRTSCSCNSNTPICQCNYRTGTCSCNSYTSTCYCNYRTSESCDCQNRYSSTSCVGLTDRTGNTNCLGYARCSSNEGRYYEDCSCFSRDACSSKSYVTCTCQFQTTRPKCECDSRTPSTCNCQLRYESCGTVTISDSQCPSRTGSCGTVLGSCNCNTRCSCDTVETYG